MTDSKISAAENSIMLAAMKDGDYKPLAVLLKDNPRGLSDEMYELIARILTGDMPKLQRGRRKLDHNQIAEQYHWLRLAKTFSKTKAISYLVRTEKLAESTVKNAVKGQVAVVARKNTDVMLSDLHDNNERLAYERELFPKGLDPE